MLPSRGLSRVNPGLGFRNQILSRPSIRSIPRQAISRSSTGAPRQFGTNLRNNGRPFSQLSTSILFSGGKIGAAGVLSSQAISLSARRFASSDSSTASPSPVEPATNTEFSSDFSAFSDLDGPSLFDIPEKVGYLSNLGLDYGWGPTSVCQWVLEHIHFTAGLSWGAAIVGVGVLMRVVMAYPALIAQYESVKSQELRKDPLYRETQKRFMAAMANSGSVGPQEVMELRMQMKLLEENGGLKKWKLFLPMLQVPFAFGMFKLTRGMAALPVPGLDSTGMFWFTDLTMPDPFYILPCVSAVMMVLSIKRAVPYMAAEQASFMKMMPWIFGPLTIFFTYNMAAAVTLYFASAAILQYLQTTLWHIPFVRKLCGLPPLVKTIVDPADRKKATPFVKVINKGRGGMQYQAPRTINTTATEQDKPTKTDSLNPITYFRDAINSAGDTVTQYTGNTEEKREKKAAAEYEARRRKEESAKYFARKDNVKQKAGKKGKGGSN